MDFWDCTYRCIPNTYTTGRTYMSIVEYFYEGFIDLSVILIFFGVGS